MIDVNICVEPGASTPEYSHEGDAGMDVRAFIDDEILINPGERKLIPTGNSFDLPDEYEIQVRPRSGLALKKGLSVLNTPGTVDSGYKGDVGIILINHSDKAFTVNPNERIAQIVFNKYEKAKLNVVTELENSERGSKGFGSTGRG